MKKSLFIVFAIVIAFSGSNSYAQRAAKPGPGPIPKSAFPPFTEKTLKNGLTVVIVEDHKQPLVYFRTVVMSGTAADGKVIGAVNAVSNLLEKGTKTRSADAIAEKLDYYGAEVSVAAGNDNINIFTSCLKKDMKDILPIYADLIKNPSFPKEELEKFKSQQISSLRAAKKQSGDPGRRLGRKLVYDIHPYGAFETEETVAKLDQDALEKYHENFFSGQNTLIGVVGDVTEKELIPLLEKYFGDLKKGIRSEATFPQLEDTHGMNFSLIDRPGSVQSTIRLQRLGLRLTDPDFDKASFLDAILAGNGLIGFQNRLFQNIREKHGYTYTPGGALTASLDRGIMVAVAEVRNSVTDSALDQMLYEYRRLATEEVSEQELNFAKGLVTGKYLMDLADPKGTSTKVLNIIQYGLPKDYYSTYPTRVQGYTAAELRKTAEKVFPPNDLHVIVTGTASQILPKLERFGKFKTYDLDLKPVKVEVAMKPSPLTVDQVIEKINAAYNKPVKTKLTSVELDGSLALEAPTGRMTGKYREVAEQSGNRYERMELQGLPLIERKSDGTKISEYQMGEISRGLQGEELANELSLNQFNKELNLAGGDITAKLLGISDTKFGDAYVLEVSRTGSSKEKWYIDMKSFYVLRKEQPTSEGDVAVEFTDYRMVDGIPFAYKRVVSAGGMDMSVTVSDVKLNQKNDPKLFETK